MKKYCLPAENWLSAVGDRHGYVVFGGADED